MEMPEVRRRMREIRDRLNWAIEEITNLEKDLDTEFAVRHREEVR